VCENDESPIVDSFANHSLDSPNNAADDVVIEISNDNTLWKVHLCLLGSTNLVAHAHAKATSTNDGNVSDNYEAWKVPLYLTGSTNLVAHMYANAPSTNDGTNTAT